jgi:hypothetical protein
MNRYQYPCGEKSTSIPIYYPHNFINTLLSGLDTLLFHLDHHTTEVHIPENTPSPGRKEYQPMPFGGGVMKRGKGEENKEENMKEKEKRLNIKGKLKFKG